MLYDARVGGQSEATWLTACLPSFRLCPPPATMLIRSLFIHLIIVTIVQTANHLGQWQRSTSMGRRRREVTYEDMMIYKKKNLHNDTRTEMQLPNGCCGEHRNVRHLAVELTEWDSEAMEYCLQEYDGQVRPLGLDPKEQWTEEDLEEDRFGPETEKSQRMVFRAAYINQCAAKRNCPALVTADDKLDREMIKDAVVDMTMDPWQRKVMAVAVDKCTKDTGGKEMRTPFTGNLSCHSTMVTFQDCLSTNIDLNCPVPQRVRSPSCLKFWSEMNMETDDKREKTY